MPTTKGAGFLALPAPTFEFMEMKNESVVYKKCRNCFYYEEGVCRNPLLSVYLGLDLDNRLSTAPEFGCILWK